MCESEWLTGAACQFILVDSTLIMSIPTINNGSSTTLDIQFNIYLLRLCGPLQWKYPEISI